MTPTNPTTQVSLILRLSNPEDAQAWEQFVEIYQPLIWRTAKRLGMSDFDAADACQNTMLRLSRVVHQWSPKKNNGSFRGWLYRVAKNCMLRQFEKDKKQPRTNVHSDDHPLWAQVDSNSDQDSTYQIEFRRQVFANAAEKIRPLVSSTSWQAFWLTYVKNRPISEVAQILDTSLGTIYVARSRVLKRIRDEVHRVSQSGLIELPSVESAEQVLPLSQHDQGETGGSHESQ